MVYKYLLNLIPDMVLIDFSRDLRRLSRGKFEGIEGHGG